MLYLTAENLDTGVVYERQLPVVQIKDILLKMYENSIEKLLMDVTLDRKTHSLHVPGLHLGEEILPTEFSQCNRPTAESMEECRKTDRVGQQPSTKRYSMAR